MQTPSVSVSTLFFTRGCCRPPLCVVDVLRSTHLVLADLLALALDDVGEIANGDLDGEVDNGEHDGDEDVPTAHTADESESTTSLLKLDICN